MHTCGRSTGRGDIGRSNSLGNYSGFGGLGFEHEDEDEDDSLARRYTKRMSFGLDRVADRKIAEALEQGKFEDLAGKGQPLNLDDDPLTPPHLRLANRILK